MSINRNDWINEVKQDAYGVTGNPAQLSTASGSAPSYSARAWVNFNGATNAIRASGNVSSITDNGVGDYTVNFTTPMEDINYGYQLSGKSPQTLGELYVAADYATAQTTTSIRVRSFSNSTVTVRDAQDYCVTIFR